MDIIKIIDLFNSRGFRASYFDDVDIAKEFLSSQISGTTVGFGGSMTLAELNIRHLLEQNNKIADHSTEKSDDVLARASAAEVYLLSANAVSATGEIVNIDGRGNRISSAMFGPNRKKVFYICGTNKIEETLEKAIWRAKNIAAPKNAQRLQRKTPCALRADKCYNCQSPERICRSTVVQTHPMFGVETHIVFIKGSFGY